MDSNAIFVKEYLLPINPFPCFGLEVLSPCRIVATNKIDPKNVNCNHHCNYSQQHLVLGEGIIVAVMVVVNTSCPLLKIEPKKVNFNNQPLNWWSCKCTSSSATEDRLVLIGLFSLCPHLWDSKMHVSDNQHFSHNIWVSYEYLIHYQSEDSCAH